MFFTSKFSWESKWTCEPIFSWGLCKCCSQLVVTQRGIFPGNAFGRSLISYFYTEIEVIVPGSGMKVS